MKRVLNKRLLSAFLTVSMICACLMATLMPSANVRAQSDFNTEWAEIFKPITRYHNQAGLNDKTRNDQVYDAVQVVLRKLQARYDLGNRLVIDTIMVDICMNELQENAKHSTAILKYLEALIQESLMDSIKAQSDAGLQPLDQDYGFKSAELEAKTRRELDALRASVDKISADKASAKKSYMHQLKEVEPEFTSDLKIKKPEHMDSILDIMDRALENWKTVVKDADAAYHRIKALPAEIEQRKAKDQQQFDAAKQAAAAEVEALAKSIDQLLTNGRSGTFKHLLDASNRRTLAALKADYKKIKDKIAADIGAAGQYAELETVKSDLKNELTRLETSAMKTNLDTAIAAKVSLKNTELASQLSDLKTKFKARSAALAKQMTQGDDAAANQAVRAANADYKKELDALTEADQALTQKKQPKPTQPKTTQPKPTPQKPNQSGPSGNYRLTVFRAGFQKFYRTGETVGLAARAEGGKGPYRYQFFVLRSSGARVNLTSLRAVNTFDWRPENPDNGYRVGVDVVDATGRKLTQMTTVKVVQKPTPQKPNQSGPSGGYRLAVFRAGFQKFYRTGETVGLAARAEGGKGPYRYQFFVLRSNGARVNLTSLRAVNTFDWRPENPDNGYRVGVDVVDASGKKLTQMTTVKVVKR